MSGLDSCKYSIKTSTSDNGATTGHFHGVLSTEADWQIMVYTWGIYASKILTAILHGML